MTSVNAKQEALLDELLKDCTSPQDILGEHGLLKQLPAFCAIKGDSHGG
jgi:putative transposase